MNEKDMVNDYLSGLKASLTGYANYISESNNEALRQTLIQIRNQDEERQRTMYQYVLQKYITIKKLNIWLRHKLYTLEHNVNIFDRIFVIMHQDDVSNDFHNPHIPVHITNIQLLHMPWIKIKRHVVVKNKE